MPINFNSPTRTLVVNGQAVNADNLNAPAVSLYDRTDEILRWSQELQYTEDHFGGSECYVVDEGGVNKHAGAIDIHYQSELDPVSGLYIRCYSPFLYSAVICVRPKSVPGANYFIKAVALQAYSANAYRSRGLCLPGSGIYLKVPKALESRDSVESKRLLDITDLDSEIISGSPALPIGTELTTLSSFTSIITNTEKTPNEIISILNDLGGSNNVLVTRDSESGELSHNIDLKGRIYFKSDMGLYYPVTRLNLDAESLVITLGSSLYLPRNNFDTEVSSNTAGFFIRDSSSFEISGLADAAHTASNTLIFGDTITLTVSPDRPDPEFYYIPVVRLLDTSIVIGDQAIDLRRGTRAGGTNSIEVWNTIGAPREVPLPDERLFGSGRFLLTRPRELVLPLGARQVDIPLRLSYTSPGGSLTSDNLWLSPEFKALIAANPLGPTKTYIAHRVKLLTPALPGSTPGYFTVSLFKDGDLIITTRIDASAGERLHVDYPCLVAHSFSQFDLLAMFGSYGVSKSVEVVLTSSGSPFSSSTATNYTAVVTVSIQ